MQIHFLLITIFRMSIRFLLISILECQFVFHYIPSTVICPELKYRIQKSVMKVEILPSLHISTSVLASQICSNEYSVIGLLFFILFYNCFSFSNLF
jgi:hypothetical protein